MIADSMTMTCTDRGGVVGNETDTFMKMPTPIRPDFV